MKEIKGKEPIYLEDYDIYVEQYLTYAQIQQIINKIKSVDSWSTVQETIDLLVLLHATDIKKEEIEKIGHDTLLKSGLIEKVFCCIQNINDIYKGLEYTQSFNRVFADVIKNATKILKNVEKANIKESANVKNNQRISTAKNINS